MSPVASKVKIIILCDVARLILVDSFRCFGEIYCLRLHPTSSIIQLRVNFVDVRCIQRRCHARGIRLTHNNAINHLAQRDYHIQMGRQSGGSSSLSTGLIYRRLSYADISSCISITPSLICHM
jgi:hypothetical protein